MARLPVLDRATIDSASPEALGRGAFSAVRRTIVYGHANIAPQIRALPTHWRAGWTTIWYHCEVHNGGHHQFFWNSEGALNAETLADLDMIGAISAAAILADALRVFEKRDYPADKAAADPGFKRFIAGYGETRMDALDQSFYVLAKDVPTCLGEFIKANRGLYLGT